jgi:N-acyl homoserine lactone hydrolase
MDQSLSMQRTLRALVSGFIVSFLAVAPACSGSTHAVEPAKLGTPRGSHELIAVIDQPGPVELVTVRSANWVVERSGLIDLDAAAAKAAGLVDGDEPIQIYFHALRHPRHGLFVVDSGVERALRDAPERAAARGLVTRFVHFDALKVVEPLGDWLAREATPLAGVFLTHMHFDHVMGLPDAPAGTPIYVGKSESSSTALMNVFTQSLTDRTLAGKPALREWQFSSDPDGMFDGVLDVFGDGSVWALWMPGHTPGSTSFLVRTPQGPVLLVGDTCHTRWGWDHAVSPGSFTADRARNQTSLERLLQLVAAHPSIDVRLGHQH